MSPSHNSLLAPLALAAATLLAAAPAGAQMPFAPSTKFESILEPVFNLFYVARKAQRYQITSPKRSHVSPASSPGAITTATTASHKPSRGVIEPHLEIK